MDNLVKRVVLIVILCLALVFAICRNEMLIHHSKIKNTMEQAMEYFANKDINSLMLMFTEDIQENRKDETIEEIEALYEFFDDEIVSYSYSKEGGGERANRYEEIYYYHCCPEFKVITNNGDEYIVEFSYHYIWNDKPEKEGINKIYVYVEGEYSNGIGAGIVYYD